MTLEFFKDLINAEKRNIDNETLKQRENDIINSTTFFDISKFEEELFINSAKSNKQQQQYSTAINAYDLLGCIRAATFKYFKIPVKSFANKWLPILMRSTIGRAVHSFIQENTKQFTETEVYVKVPKLHFSGRIDAIINNNVLVEIKTCAYTDYKNILKDKRPRVKDFYQTIIYKYFLENYCDEIRNYCQENSMRYGNPPKQEKYYFTNIQYIYVAHDIISSETVSISHSLKTIREIKKQLNSKNNKFFFITSLVINSENDKIKDALSYIVDRITEFNKFIESNKIPPTNHKYVDNKDCYFCIYRDICEKY